MTAKKTTTSSTSGTRQSKKVASKVTTIKMTTDKECKHSTRYAADDGKAPIQSVYLSKSFAPVMPASIIVTVQ